jgi:hypothetical protein
VNRIFTVKYNLCKAKLKCFILFFIAILFLVFLLTAAKKSANFPLNEKDFRLRMCVSESYLSKHAAGLNLLLLVKGLKLKVCVIGFQRCTMLQV